MSNIKYNWVYGEDEEHKYYETYVGQDYLCVFANKLSHPDLWIGVSRDKTIFDKTKNNKQRQKEKVPCNTSHYMLRNEYLLVSSDYVYMMRKVEYCYRHNIDEVSE